MFPDGPEYPDTLNPVVPPSHTPFAGAPVDMAEPTEYGSCCCYLAICLALPNSIVDCERVFLLSCMYLTSSVAAFDHCHERYATCSMGSYYSIASVSADTQSPSLRLAVRPRRGERRSGEETEIDKPRRTKSSWTGIDQP